MFNKTGPKTDPCGTPCKSAHQRTNPLSESFEFLMGCAKGMLLDIQDTEKLVTPFGIAKFRI